MWQSTALWRGVSSADDEDDNDEGFNEEGVEVDEDDGDCDDGDCDEEGRGKGEGDDGYDGECEA